MKRPSLTRQVETALTEKLQTGQSKHEAKIAGTAKDGIFSFKTLKTYMEQANYFTKYCKEKHGCKYLSDCQKYVNEYLEYRIEQGNSPYTLHLIRSAICKLYGTTSKDYIELPKRKRQDITRSRGEVIRDKHFSEQKHKEIIDFCKGSGLRRHELAQLKGTDILYTNKGAFLVVRRGKGGRSRIIPISSEDAGKIIPLMKSAGDALVFPDVPQGMDVHSYRAIFATNFYNRLARPTDQIPQQEKYICRKDRKGIILDKRAMLEVSKALGHNRISVIAEHYLIDLF